MKFWNVITIKRTISETLTHCVQSKHQSGTVNNHNHSGR